MITREELEKYALEKARAEYKPEFHGSSFDENIPARSAYYAGFGACLDLLWPQIEMLTKVRDYLDEDVAMLPMESRVVTMDEDTWSEAMYLRDVIDDALFEAKKKLGW